MIIIALPLFVLCTIWAPLLFAFLMIEALNDGVVRTRSRDPNDSYGAYSRANEPFMFWSLIAMYGVVVVGVCYIYFFIARSLLYGE